MIKIEDMKYYLQNDKNYSEELLERLYSNLSDIIIFAEQMAIVNCYSYTYTIAVMFADYKRCILANESNYPSLCDGCNNFFQKIAALPTIVSNALPGDFVNGFINKIGTTFILDNDTIIDCFISLFIISYQEDLGSEILMIDATHDNINHFDYERVYNMLEGLL